MCIRDRLNYLRRRRNTTSIFWPLWTRLPRWFWFHQRGSHETSVPILHRVAYFYRLRWRIASDSDSCWIDDGDSAATDRRSMLATSERAYVSSGLYSSHDTKVSALHKKHKTSEELNRTICSRRRLATGIFHRQGVAANMYRGKLCMYLYRKTLKIWKSKIPSYKTLPGQIGIYGGETP